MPQIGNFLGGAFTHNMQTGSGLPHGRIPFGHVTLSGVVGDVVVIPVTAFYPKFYQVFNGIVAQAIGSCAVSIKSTLADIDLAGHPAQTDIWVSPVTVASGSIVALAKMTTAIQVTFTADGVLYLAGA